MVREQRADNVLVDFLVVRVAQQVVAHLPQFQNVCRIQFTRVQILVEHRRGRPTGQHVFQTVRPPVQVVFGHGGIAGTSARHATHIPADELMDGTDRGFHE